MIRSGAMMVNLIFAGVNYHLGHLRCIRILCREIEV